MQIVATEEGKINKAVEYLEKLILLEIKSCEESLLLPLHELQLEIY